MSEAEYAILDHLESVCRELRTMIRTTEKGALQDVQLGDLVSCLYTALDSAVVVCDEYQSRPQALKNWIIARLCDGDTVKAGAGI